MVRLAGAVALVAGLLASTASSASAPRRDIDMRLGATAPPF